MHTRREFLQAAAMVTGALAGPGAGALMAAQPSPRAPVPAWRLALSSVMFDTLSVEEFCAKAAELGFEAIDLWCPFGRCRHLESAARGGSSSFKALLAKHKLQAGSFTVYRTGVWKEGFPAFARFIGECGGGLVVRESDYRQVEAGELSARIRSFFEALKPEIELAGSNGCTLAIENHGRALLGSLDSFKAFMDLNPDPKHVGVALAPYHLQAVPVPIEEAIRTCGSQLRFFYAWQKAEGADQLPGIGPADFAPWLKALAAAPGSGLVSPFMHGQLPPPEMSQLLARSLRYLKSCASLF